MGRRKREPMDPAKKNIVSELIKTYDIKTAKDIQEALKDLLGETLQDMLEAEMNEHLGYEKYSRDEDVVNSRNGYKSKKLVVLWVNLRLMFLRIGDLNLNRRLLKKDKKIYLRSSKK